MSAVDSKRLAMVGALLLAGCHYRVGLPHLQRVADCSDEALLRGDAACQDEAARRPTSFVRVDFTAGVRPLALAPPVVTVSEAARAESSTWKTGAVDVSGACRGTGNPCATWVGAVERALVARGVTLVAAPAQPQFVLVVREASLGAAGGAEAYEDVTYLASDAGGSAGAPLALDPQSRRTLREFVGGRAAVQPDGAIVVGRLFATVQATSGATVWSYDGSAQERLRPDVTLHALFGERAGVYWPVAPEGRSIAPDGTTRDGAGDDHAWKTPVSEDESRAALVRRMAEDLVSRLGVK